MSGTTEFYDPAVCTNYFFVASPDDPMGLSEMALTETLQEICHDCLEHVHQPAIQLPKIAWSPMSSSELTRPAGINFLGLLGGSTVM